MMHLTAEKLQACWLRLQQEVLGRCGRKDYLLYKYCKILLGWKN